MANRAAVRNAPTPERVRAILRRQIADVRTLLRTPRTLSDKAVHDARKTLKRARAGLRLLRDSIDATAYRRENAALRDAARPLSAQRDARVVLDVARRLIEAEKDPAVRAILVRLSRILRNEWSRGRARGVHSAKGLRLLASALDRVETRTAKFRLTDDARAVRASLEAIYRQGRKALRGAEAARSDETLHELRKQVKYLGAAMKYCVEMGAPALATRIERADSIADDLGDDHDLAVLQAKLATMPADAGHTHVVIASRSKRARTALQKKALKNARLLYRRKPSRFVAGV